VTVIALLVLYVNETLIAKLSLKVWKPSKLGSLWTTKDGTFVCLKIPASVTPRPQNVVAKSAPIIF